MLYYGQLPSNGFRTLNPPNVTFCGAYACPVVRMSIHSGTTQSKRSAWGGTAKRGPSGFHTKQPLHMCRTIAKPATAECRVVHGFFSVVNLQGTWSVSATPQAPCTSQRRALSLTLADTLIMPSRSRNISVCSFRGQITNQHYIWPISGGKHRASGNVTKRLTCAARAFMLHLLFKITNQPQITKKCTNWL